MGDKSFDFEFEWTREQARRARRFCGFLRLGKRDGVTVFALVATGAFGIMFVTFVLLTFELFSNPRPDAMTGDLSGAAFWSLAISALSGFAIFQSTVLKTRPEFDVTGTVRVYIDGAGASFYHSNQGRHWPADLLWGFEENDTFMLLLTAKGFLAFPRSAVPQLELESLRKFLLAMTAIRNKTFGFPVEVPGLPDAPGITPPSGD